MMDQDTVNFEAMKLAIGLAKDASVQLITLSTALIVLTVGFSKDIRKALGTAEMILVIAMLASYMCSIVCGLFALLRLIGSLAPVGTAAKLSLDAARGGASWQIGLFALGTFLFTMYGVIAILTLWKRKGDQRP